MAIYRQVHTTFWQDPFVLDNLNYKEKYFYLYLMTNSKTTQCGIYEISEVVMMLETGLDRKEILEMIKKLEDCKKIEYNKQTKEIYLLNWVKYNPVNNTNIEKCVVKELRELKSDDFRISFISACIDLDYNIPLINKAYKGLISGLHTPTKKEEEEEEQEEEKEEEQEQGKTATDNNIFREYEKAGFGIASSTQAEMLMELEKNYGYEWTVDALKESAKNNVLKISYAEAILKNWATNGRSKNESGRKNTGDHQKQERSYATEVNLDDYDESLFDGLI